MAKEVHRTSQEEMRKLFQSGKIEVVNKAPAIIHPEGVKVSWKEAERIMGDDYLGLEAIENTFGGVRFQKRELKKVLDAPFPFTGQELERHKELGGFLILRTDSVQDDSTLGSVALSGIVPTSMYRLRNRLTDIFEMKQKGVVLQDSSVNQDYRQEDFYKTEFMQAKVALVSKDVIPGSTSKNYLRQTMVIADYLQTKVFKGIQMPLEYRQAIQEFELEKQKIALLMNSDINNASKSLALLRINQLTRHTATEAMYDLAVYFDNKGERLLGQNRTWTKSRNASDDLVSLGGFNARGMWIDYYNVRSSGNIMGVCLSR